MLYATSPAAVTVCNSTGWSSSMPSQRLFQRRVFFAVGTA
jgi:hypothetical protein